MTPPPQASRGQQSERGSLAPVGFKWEVYVSTAMEEEEEDMGDPYQKGPCC